MLCPFENFLFQVFCAVWIEREWVVREQGFRRWARSAERARGNFGNYRMNR